MQWIADRLSERGTWAGILVLASGVLHFTVSAPVAEAIASAGVALGGLLAVVMKEQGNA